MNPPIRVIFIDDHPIVRKGMIQIVADDGELESIPAGIKSAARGEFYVSPSLARHTVRRSQRTSEFHKSNAGLVSLTPTERIVLKGVAENKSSREIAAELGVSYRTVTTHRNHISHKLGLTGNQPLLNFALANKSAIFSMLKG